MKEITLEELLEAGCHFGHQVTRHNPKARDFIFEERDNIHIIDLAKTKEGLDEAAQFIFNLAQNGGTLLVVGSKKQAQPIVHEEVAKAQKEGATDLFYVTNRWIGGIITNLPEVSKNFKKLKDYTLRLNDPEEKAKYTKKEIAGWDKDREKLQSLYGGVADLKNKPSALFIIDTHLEDLAVREGTRTSVPMVGITDTNSDPTYIDYPIPANDDAVGSLQLIISHILSAWTEGKKAGRSHVEKLAKEAAESKVEEVEKKVEKIESQRNTGLASKEKKVKEEKPKKEKVKKA